MRESARTDLIGAGRQRSALPGTDVSVDRIRPKTSTRRFIPKLYKLL